MATRRPNRGALQVLAGLLGALVFGLGTLHPGLSGAEERSYQLRWVAPTEPDLAGYKVYVAVDEGAGSMSPAEGIDIGMHDPDSNGVASFELGGLDATLGYEVAMTAYDELLNESAPSNALRLAPICPPEGCAPACTSDADCSDGDPCSGEESCTAGVCEPGEPLVCTTTLQCKVARCEPFFGCFNQTAPIGQVCDDGDPLTYNDRCFLEGCSGDHECSLDAHCADGNPCNGAETCVNFQCRSGAPADGAVCNDGDAGTYDDVCAAGTCGGTPGCTSDAGCGAGHVCRSGRCEFSPECQVDAECADTNPCNGAETCVDFQCRPGAPADGAVCNDGNAGTYDDVCAAGTCGGTPVCTSDAECGAGHVCRSGRCEFSPECRVDAECADTNPCNGAETCVDFQCRPGAPADGAVCNDGDAGTYDDVCAAGTCGGTPICRADADCGDPGLMCSAGRCETRPEPEVCYGRPGRPTIVEGDDPRTSVRIRWIAPAHPLGAALETRKRRQRAADHHAARRIEEEGCKARYEVELRDLEPGGKHRFRVSGEDRRGTVWSAYYGFRTKR